MKTKLMPLYTPSISFDDNFSVHDTFDEGIQQYSLYNDYGNFCLCWINRGYFNINKDIDIDDYLQVLQEFLMQNYDFKSIPTKKDILKFIKKEIKGYEELVKQEREDYLNILNGDDWYDDWAFNETTIYTLEAKKMNNNALQNVTKFIEFHKNYALTFSKDFYGDDESYYTLFIYDFNDREMNQERIKLL